MMCRSVCSITVDTRKSLQCKKGWLKGLKTSLIFNVLDSFQILEFSHFFLLHPSLFLSVLFICWKGKLKHPIYTIIQISHLVLGNNDSLRSSRESSYQCGTPFFNREFSWSHSWIFLAVCFRSMCFGSIIFHHRQWAWALWKTASTQHCSKSSLPALT